MSTALVRRIVYDKNDTTLRFPGLFLNDGSGTKVAQNSATVTARIKDKETDTDVTLSSGTWPITLTYVSASSGDYIGNLPDEAVFVLVGGEQLVVIEIDVVSGSRHALIRLDAVVEVRTE